MKTLIATAAIALSLTAPSFAQVGNAQAFFALGNDSAAERVLSDTSTGDKASIELKNRLSKESSAERTAPLGGEFAARADNSSAEVFFSMFNDSAAEIQ